jgi:hypothetical protein
VNRVALVVVLAVVVSSPGAAEQSDGVVCSAERTSAPLDARYEILRTASSGRVLKVDKATGQVSMLEHGGGLGSRATWRLIPPPDDKQLMAVNYQVVLSPASGETLLLNLHSGNTWLLRTTRTSPEWIPVVPER